MLKLLAISPEDGWAFVRNGGKLVLVRPPYASQDLLLVSGGDVETAVLQHGFRRDPREFTSWSEVVRFLRETLVSARKETGIDVPDPGVAGRRALQEASAERIAGILGQIEERLVARGRWSRAIDLLCTVIALPVARDDTDLHARTAQLLVRAHRGRDADMQRRGELIRQATSDRVRTVCPLASQHHDLAALTEWMNEMARRRHVLAV